MTNHPSHQSTPDALTLDDASNEALLKDPSVHQLPLPLAVMTDGMEGSYLENLASLLTGDLDFHGNDAGYASHNYHPFPAKFPPPLPRTFIRGLTRPGDVVVDPMMGSGTTIVEAYLLGRQAKGYDIDPLAVLLTKVKTTSLDTEEVLRIGNEITERAAHAVDADQATLVDALDRKWDGKTRQFVDYWFARETQIELIALLREIEKVQDDAMGDFFRLAFSSCIITKSGGVSLAFDLAHTRPHRAKMVYSQNGELLLGEEYLEDESPRIKFLTKRLRSAIGEFHKRFLQNARSLVEIDVRSTPPVLELGDAQAMTIPDGSVDLIVTSPPYASNAIDYMRAHKFSLVWLGYPIDVLGETRKECIGGESVTAFAFEPLPERTAGVVAAVTELDPKKGKVLHRYYSEMTRVLREMYRVLKPDRAAVLVVATSIMRGKDTETHRCLADIGESLGFITPPIGVRRLDRNRRMMPAGMKIDKNSQIQQRMHEEFVVGFYKPIDLQTLRFPISFKTLARHWRSTMRSYAVA